MQRGGSRICFFPEEVCVCVRQVLRPAGTSSSSSSFVVCSSSSWIPDRKQMLSPPLFPLSPFILPPLHFSHLPPFLSLSLHLLCSPVSSLSLIPPLHRHIYILCLTLFLPPSLLLLFSLWFFPPILSSLLWLYFCFLIFPHVSSFFLSSFPSLFLSSVCYLPSSVHFTNIYKKTTQHVKYIQYYSKYLL